MRQVEAAGQRIDAGPTVLTMRWVFEGLFADAGTALAEQLRLSPLEVLARHAWQDGSRLNLFADRERSAAAIAEFAGPAEARGFHAFSAHAEAIYRQVSEPFIGAARPTLPSLAASLGLGGLRNIFRSTFTAACGRRSATSSRTRGCASCSGATRPCTGSDPFTSTATLNLIAHVEQLGVWTVERAG